MSTKPNSRLQSLPLLFNVINGDLRPKENLHDTVKGGYSCCSVIYYKFKSGESDIESKEQTHLFKYNDNGDLIETTLYNSDGSIDSQFYYKYTDTGKENEFIFFDADGSVKTKQIIKFNKFGQRTEELSFNPDGSFCNRRIYKYDENNNIVEDVSINRDGLNDYKTTYKYDENRNLIESIQVDCNESLISSDKMMYNTNGQIIERLHIFKNLMQTTESFFKFKSIYNYDENGNEIENKEFNSEDELEKCNINKYIGKGKLIEHISYSCKNIYISSICEKNDNSFILDEILKERIYSDFPKMTQINNDSGDLKERNWFNEDGSIAFKHIYNYDENGNIIEYLQYDKNNILRSKHKYERDAEGNTIDYGTVFNSSFYEKKTYNYDENGNLIEQFWHNRADKIYHKLVNKYDEMNNLIEGYCYASDGTNYPEFTYKYDENGNIIEYVWYWGSRINKKNSYKYDKFGNMLEFISFDNENLRYKTTCKYDEFGNITEYIKYINDDIPETKTKFIYSY